MSNDQIRCPKCGSNQIHADKKGFSAGQAAAGAFVGGVLAGAVAGDIGRNKIYITCLNCGHRFKLGEQLKSGDATIEKRFQDGYVKPIAKNEEEKPRAHKCHYCGRIAHAERNCPSCGTPYNENDLHVVSSNPSTGHGILIAVVIVILACILFFGILS
jgi:uncharacterized paraquat-inducible protein A